MKKDLSLVKDQFMYDVIEESMSRCKQAILSSTTGEELKQNMEWWHKDYGNYENICYSGSGPHFFIDDFNILSRDEVKEIYDLDCQNAGIIANAIKTDDLSSLSTALQNLQTISGYYCNNI